jgi:hypothetical protein
MKRILLAVLLAVTFFGTGCARINPRLDQKIDNQQGKIDEIRSNQNGVMLDLLKLKQQTEIQDSQLKEVQQGVVNLNAAVSRNENSGIQILQGDGALILVFALGVVGMILYYFYTRATKAEKSAQIMAQEIARRQDPLLEDNVLRAALNTESEANVYHLLQKNKLK